MCLSVLLCNVLTPKGRLQGALGPLMLRPLPWSLRAPTSAGAGGVPTPSQACLPTTLVSPWL